jgi:hypothetical protein
VEGLDPRDAVYGGALAIVCLLLTLLTVPIMTGTIISDWTDRALDTQRLNLREDRVAVHEAQARVADDYRQRGLFGPELSSATGTVLGAFAKVESVARGFQTGLRFLSLFLLAAGLLVTILLSRAPTPFPVLGEPRRAG